MSTNRLNSGSSRKVSRFKIRCLWVAAILVVVIGGSALALFQADRNDRISDAALRSSTVPVRVHSLARLEPQSRVIRLSSPTAAEGSRIEALKVREGDALQAGQVVAVLDTYDRRKSSLGEAEARVRVAQAKLLQIKAGAKSGDVIAQQSAVNRCRFVLKNAEAELERFRKLAASRTVSESDFEQRKLQVERSQQDLEQAEATLDSLREVRQVDIDLQEQEIASAIATAARARADLDATLIKTPIAGHVLRIHTREGERVGDKGVMEIGQIDLMYVVAEVYEADISRIRIGQTARAKLTGSTLSVAGQVEEIGLIVGRKDVLNNDPVSDTDARVIEVRVRLNSADSSRVSGFSNARCEITFDGETAAPTTE
jgi:HlyD family secretion protein